MTLELQESHICYLTYHGLKPMYFMHAYAMIMFEIQVMKSDLRI